MTTTVDRKLRTTLRLDTKTGIEIKEPKFHAIFVHSKHKYVCKSTIIDSLSNCLSSNYLSQPLENIVKLVEYNKLIQCTKPFSKEIAATLADKLNSYLRSFTDNNRCYCGSNVEYVIQEVN